MKLTKNIQVKLQDDVHNNQYRYEVFIRGMKSNTGYIYRDHTRPRYEVIKEIKTFYSLFFK